MLAEGVVIDKKIHASRVDPDIAFFPAIICGGPKFRVPRRLIAGQRLTVLQDDNFGSCSMRGSHDQVYGGCLVFQSQSVRSVFDCLEVLGSGGPTSSGIEKVFFQCAGENIVGNLIFLESTLVANSPRRFPR